MDVNEYPYFDNRSHITNLPKEEMSTFGLYPAWDNFTLVTCEICGKNIKIQAFLRHMNLRHPSLEAKGDLLDDVGPEVNDDDYKIENLRESNFIPSSIRIKDAERLQLLERKRRLTAPTFDSLACLLGKEQEVSPSISVMAPRRKIQFMCSTMLDGEYTTGVREVFKEEMSTIAGGNVCNDEECIEGTPQKSSKLSRKKSRRKVAILKVEINPTDKQFERDGTSTTGKSSPSSITDSSLIDLDCVNSPSISVEYICQYPPPGVDVTDCVKISLEDYKTLKPGVFLNDNIIDFFIKKVYYEALVKSIQPDVHVFNSMFFQKLSSCDAESIEKFQEVENWTRKINLFNKRMVLIPVCQSSHWFLVFVFGLAEERPFLVVLDSLGGRQEDVAEIVRSFLVWCSSRKKMTEDQKDAISNMSILRPDKPNQTDGTECGVYLLLYVSYVFKNLAQFYHLPDIQADMSSNWFTIKEVTDMRPTLVSTIRNLTLAQKGECCVPTIIFDNKILVNSEIDSVTEDSTDTVLQNVIREKIETDKTDLSISETTSSFDELDTSGHNSALKLSIGKLLSELDPQHNISLSTSVKYGHNSYVDDTNDTSAELFRSRSYKRQISIPIPEMQKHEVPFKRFRLARKIVPKSFRYTDKEFYTGRNGRSEMMFDKFVAEENGDWDDNSGLFSD